METDRLKYFCAIVDLGSLTKASEILGISHSGLSKSISILQHEVGLELLRPQGRGLEVTALGLEFYKKAQDILTLVESLDAPTEALVPPVRLGLSEVLAVTLAAELSRSLQQKLVLNQSDVGEIEQLILDNELDFGIASVPSPDPKLEYLKIGKISFNSYCKGELYKAFADKSEIPFAVPLYALPKNIMGYKVRDGWPENIKRNAAFQVSSLSIALNLLRAGEAAAFIPDYLYKEENKLIKNDNNKLVKIKEHQQAKIEREYFLIKPKSSPETQAMKKAASVLRKLCL